MRILKFAFRRETAMPVLALALASAASVALLGARIVSTGNLRYSFLAWNLFLAWLPLMFALLACDRYESASGRSWGFLGLASAWLLFFPNAPYLVTDFYHLGWRPPMPLWYDIGLIAVFAFTGCFLAIASLRTMHLLVDEYLGGFVGWLFVLIALGMAGLGVYLGRFGRWNSWDVLIHPRSLLKEIALQVLNPLDNLGFVGFTLMFTSIMVVFYLMFVSSKPRS